MNPKDTSAVVADASKKFSDPRVDQFYDPFQKSGDLIGEMLPLNARVAWDIYLFFRKNEEWGKTLPLPMEWMHQMEDTDTGSKYLRQGDDLCKGLYDAMDEIKKHMG